MQRTFRGKQIQIEVTNPKSHCKGVSALSVDGVTIAGNLAAHSLLKDGSQILAILD
jgi:hypothetical protein